MPVLGSKYEQVDVTLCDTTEASLAARLVLRGEILEGNRRVAKRRNEPRKGIALIRKTLTHAADEDPHGGHYPTVDLAASYRVSCGEEPLPVRVEYASRPSTSRGRPGELMTSPEATALAYWKEHREQFRQSETQRATFTNFALVITAALSALVVQQRFSAASVVLCVFITALGGYGALTVAKYYERASYHLSQARALTAVLVKMGVLGSEEELAENRTRHYASFPRLHRVRLYHLWIGLHLGVCAYGIALICVCLVTIL